MGQLFKGWRRKLGFLTLAMAFVFTGAWARSFTVDEFVEFPFDGDSDIDIDSAKPTISGLAIQEQSLVLYWFSEPIETFAAEPAPTTIQTVNFSSDKSQSEEFSGSGKVELAVDQAETPILPVTLCFQSSERNPSGDHKQFGDEHLYLLESIPGLTRLSLTNTATTEDCFKSLKNLKNLDTLLLGSTETTDAGIKDIIELKNLTVLNLGGTKITDAAMKEIQNLQKLTCLNVMNTAITDDGLKAIGQLTQLTNLYLGSTKITDIGVKEIGVLKALSELYLTDTKVSDVAMKGIGGLKRLSSLDLSGTNVTDTGLKELVGLNELKWVSLAKTQVTRAGKRLLKESLPNLQIE